MATIATGIGIAATVYACTQTCSAGPAGGQAASGSSLEDGDPFPGKRRPGDRAARETAPSTWADSIDVLAHALQWSFRETLGTWRTVDLTLGLAYLARRKLDPLESSLMSHGKERIHGRDKIHEIRVLIRLLGFCMNLRERKPGRVVQLMHEMGVGNEDLLVREPRAGIMRPAFVVLRDEELRQVVLVVRGTHSMKDTLTCINGAAQPHHAHHAGEEGGGDPGAGGFGGAGGSGGGGRLVLGYAHSGMLAAARWVHKAAAPALAAALEANPDYHLNVVGHSLGGGTAVLLTMMLRESPRFRTATCVAFACPACLTEDLSQACAPYVTSIINGADVVPTFSTGALDRLRAEVVESAWYEDFTDDLARSGSLGWRVVGTGGRAVASASRAALSTVSSWKALTLSSWAHRDPSSGHAGEATAPPASSGAGGGKSRGSEDGEEGEGRTAAGGGGGSGGGVEGVAMEAAEAAGAPSSAQADRDGAITPERLRPAVGLARGLGGGEGPRNRRSRYGCFGWAKQRDGAGSGGPAAPSASSVPPLPPAPPPTPPPGPLLDDAEAEAGAEAGGAGGGGAAAAAGAGGGAGVRECGRRPQMYPAGRVLHLVRAGMANDDITGSPPRPAAGYEGAGNRFWMYDGVGLAMYAEMRLTRAMVRDHFLPSYLEALTGVLCDLNDEDEDE